MSLFTAGGLNHAVGEELATIEVAWETMKGATAYELEFKPLDVVGPPLHFKTKKTQFQAEVPRGRYGFRIRSIARGGRMGSWSEAVELQAGSLEVNLKSPEDGQLVKSSGTLQPVRFTWEPMAGAKEYYVWIWDVNSDPKNTNPQR